MVNVSCISSAKVSVYIGNDKYYVFFCRKHQPRRADAALHSPSWSGVETRLLRSIVDGLLRKNERLVGSFGKQ